MKNGVLVNLHGAEGIRGLHGDVTMQFPASEENIAALRGAVELLNPSTQVISIRAYER